MMSRVYLCTHPATCFASAFRVVTCGSAALFRIWLEGPSKDQFSIFADGLPGLPDNIMKSSDGGYWVSIVVPRHAGIFDAFGFLGRHPLLRAWLSKVSFRSMVLVLVQSFMRFYTLFSSLCDRWVVAFYPYENRCSRRRRSRRCGSYVVKIGEDGRVLGSLHDPSHYVAGGLITQATEHEGASQGTFCRCFPRTRRRRRCRACDWSERTMYSSTPDARPFTFSQHTPRHAPQASFACTLSPLVRLKIYSHSVKLSYVPFVSFNVQYCTNSVVEYCTFCISFSSFFSMCHKRVINFLWIQRKFYHTKFSIIQSFLSY